MSISTPVQITVPFATSGLKNAIPGAANPITGNAGYDLGFPAINMTPKIAGGIPPFGQDFNGVFFDVTTAIQYLEAGGSFPYSSTFSTAIGGYPLGAIVSRTDGSGLWRNTVANNTTNPETFGANWQPEDAGSSPITMTNANVTLTALQAARSIIVITGVLTTNLQLILPTYIKQWVIANNCTGAFTITAKTAAGSGIAISTLSSVQVYGDGTNINGAATSSSVLPRAYFSGLGLTNNVSAPNTTIDVSAGSAKDSTNTLDINLSSTFSGVLQAAGSWTAGNNQNKLDTGAKAINTWYHVFAIRKTSDGSGDILFSLSPTAPTMPTGYAGFVLSESILTDGSGNILPFVNVGRALTWKTVRQDVVLSSVAPGNSTVTISTPPGRRVKVKQYAALSADGGVIYTHSPDVNNETLGFIGGGWKAGISINNAAIAAENVSGLCECVTGVVSDIVLQTSNAGGNMSVVQLATLGWEKL